MVIRLDDSTNVRLEQVGKIIIIIIIIYNWMFITMQDDFLNPFYFNKL